VDHRERFEQRMEDGGEARDRQGRAHLDQQRMQAASIEPFEHQEWQSRLGLAVLEELDHQRMRGDGQRVRLVQELPAAALVIGEVGMKDLQGDAPAIAAAARLVHAPHPALGDHPEDLVLARHDVPFGLHRPCHPGSQLARSIR
jgi:hypothetical protein